MSKLDSMLLGDQIKRAVDLAEALAADEVPTSRLKAQNSFAQSCAWELRWDDACRRRDEDHQRFLVREGSHTANPWVSLLLQGISEDPRTDAEIRRIAAQGFRASMCSAKASSPEALEDALAAYRAASRIKFPWPVQPPTPVLDNYDGFACISFVNGLYLRADKNGIVEGRPGEEYRIELWLQKHQPARAEANVGWDLLRITDGKSSPKVEFEVTMYSDVPEFGSSTKGLTVAPDGDSEHLSWAFRAPEDAGRYGAWARISQKGCLLQVVRTFMEIPKGRRRARKCGRTCRSHSR